MYANVKQMYANIIFVSISLSLVFIRVPAISNQQLAIFSIKFLFSVFIIHNLNPKSIIKVENFLVKF